MSREVQEKSEKEHPRGMIREDIAGYYCDVCGRDIDKPCCEAPVSLSDHDLDIIHSAAKLAFQRVSPDVMSVSRERLQEALDRFAAWRRQGDQRARLRGVW